MKQHRFQQVYARRPGGVRHLSTVAPIAVLVVLAGLAGCDGTIGRTPAPGEPRSDSARVLREEKAAQLRHEIKSTDARVHRAARYARRDEGLISFALIDQRGRSHGFDPDRQYVSASAVKSMLLAAELRRLNEEGLRIDPGTASTLAAMITLSDNDAADQIYYRVGDEGLFEVAERAGMKNFEVAGHWGNAQLTAADMALFFNHLDRNLVGSDSGFGKKLLNSVIPEQSWGIPAVAGDRWRPYFKGGWRSTDLGELAHQAALLEGPNGERISLAVLTDGQVSGTDAIADIETIAAILLDRPPTESGPGGRPGD